MVHIGNYTDYQWSKIKQVFNNKNIVGEYKLVRLQNGKSQLYVEKPEAVAAHALSVLFCVQQDLDSLREVDTLLNGF